MNNVNSIVFNGAGGSTAISIQDTAGNSTLTVNGNTVSYSNASTAVIPIALSGVTSMQAADNSSAGHDTINVQATTVATTIGYLHGVGDDTYNVASDAPTNQGIVGTSRPR